MVRRKSEDTTHWTFPNISRPENKLVRDKYRAS